jgi:CTP:molybdopterin cytidylyltransferase MocA
MSVAAVVLAAGAATRYGRPKQRELLPSVLARLSETAVDEVVVVAGAYELDVEAVQADDWERGPGASLRAGLASLGDEVTHALVVLADGPELDPRAVARLLEHRDEAPVLAASFDGTRDHPVLLAREVWPAIPDEGGRALDAKLVDCSDLHPPGDVDVP